MPRKEHVDAFNGAAGIAPSAVERFGEGAAPRPQKSIKIVDQDSGQISEGDTIDERELAPSRRKFVATGGAVSSTPTTRAKAVTSSTPGVDVAQTQPLAAVASKITEFHTMLSDRARELNASHPVASNSEGQPVPTTGRMSSTEGKVLATDSLERGNQKLAAAKQSIIRAEDSRYGRNVTGENPKNSRSNADANVHYQAALGHITAAHGHLHSGSIESALSASKSKISAKPVSSEELATWKGHADNLQVVKQKPFKTAFIGKDTVLETGTPEFKATKKKMKEVLKTSGAAYTGEAIAKMGESERGSGKKSSVQKGAQRERAEQGFVPPASKAAPKVSLPNQRTSSASKGTGLAAQKKPGTVTGNVTNVTRPSMGDIARRGNK